MISLGKAVPTGLQEIPAPLNCMLYFWNMKRPLCTLMINDWTLLWERQDLCGSTQDWRNPDISDVTCGKNKTANEYFPFVEVFLYNLRWPHSKQSKPLVKRAAYLLQGKPRHRQNGLNLQHEVPVSIIKPSSPVFMQPKKIRVRSSVWPLERPVRRISLSVFPFCFLVNLRKETVYTERTNIWTPWPLCLGCSQMQLMFTPHFFWMLLIPLYLKQLSITFSCLRILQPWIGKWIGFRL